MAKVTIGSIKMKQMLSKYLWKIDNFNSVEANRGVPIYSPVFRTPYYSSDQSSEKICYLHWRIRLYPNGGYDRSPKDYMAIVLESIDNVNVVTDYSLAIVNSKNVEAFSHLSSEVCFGEKKHCGWLVNKKCLEMADNDIILLDDSLTISCSICKLKVDADKQEPFNNLSTLDYFESLLETGDLSDVVFVISEESIGLHKTILSSLSAVFYSMFITNADDKEKNNVQRVTISSDIKYDVIKEMFRYIYARKVNNIEEIAGDLYVAADKYNVEGLKVLCEKTLCKNLNTDNALQYLELAVKYDMSELKPKVIEIVTKNLENVVVIEGFKLLSVDCKDELLKYVANKKHDQ